MSNVANNSPSIENHVSASRPSRVIRLVDGNNQWSMVSSASGKGAGSYDAWFVQSKIKCCPFLLNKIPGKFAILMEL